MGKTKVKSFRTWAREIEEMEKVRREMKIQTFSGFILHLWDHFKRSTGRVMIFVAFLNLFTIQLCFAAEIPEAQAIRAIIGESSSQGEKGMFAVACAIRNRGTLKGVYGVNAKHVDSEPQWVWEMAKKVWKESEFNRIHDGDHWENIKAFGKPYWVSSMVEVYRHKDHVFYKERD